MRNSLQKYYFYLYKRVVFAIFFEKKLCSSSTICNF